MWLLPTRWNVSSPRPAMTFSPNFLDPIPYIPVQIRFSLPYIQRCKKSSSLPSSGFLHSIIIPNTVSTIYKAFYLGYFHVRKEGGREERKEEGRKKTLTVINVISLTLLTKTLCSKKSPWNSQHIIQCLPICRPKIRDYKKKSGKAPYILKTLSVYWIIYTS